MVVVIGQKALKTEPNWLPGGDSLGSSNGLSGTEER